MPTLARRGSGTPATTNTSWAGGTNLANAIDGTPGTNPATYVVWTNTTANAVGTIEVSGYNFSDTVGASDTLTSVTVTSRSLVSNTSRVTALTMQPFDGSTAIGSAFTCTRATSATDNTTTFPVTLAQLRSATFKIRMTATRFNGTQAGTFSLDHIDVTADYEPPVQTWTGSEGGVGVAGESGTWSAPTEFQAVRFDAGSDRYSRVATGIAAPDMTWCCWVKLIEDPDYYQSWLSVDDAGSTYHKIGTAGNGTTYWLDTNPSGISNAYDLVPGSWYFVGSIWRSGSFDSIFYAAAGDASITFHNPSSNVTGPDTTKTFYIGSSGFSDYIHGSMAQVKVWSAALSEAEITTEWPVDGVARTADLWAYYSFRDGPQTNDESINGRTLTAGGTVTLDVEGPPVTALALGGKIKVWNGSAWVDKPIKVWTGAAWVEKPLKVWTGSAWALS